MMTTPDTLKYPSKLRPSDLSNQLEIARKAGHDINTHPEIQALIAHFQKEFYLRQGQYAESTIQRLQYSWGIFVQWCVDNNKNALPASPETVEMYLKQQASSLRRNTIKVNCWAIAKTHKISGCPDPTKDIYVEGQVKQIVRQKKLAGETVKQATPFTEFYLNQLIELWGNSHSYLNIRDLMVMAMAYESMLRESEIARIKIKHLLWQSDGSLLLIVPITKTNHSDNDDAIYLSKQIAPLIQRYLTIPDIDTNDEAFLIQPFTKVGSVKFLVEPTAVSPKTIERIFLRSWRALGLESLGVKKFTGHSARVGAAQDLLRDGFTTLQVQQSGRWASERMVLHYGRGILAQDSAMAKKRRR